MACIAGHRRPNAEQQRAIFFDRASNTKRQRCCRALPLPSNSKTQGPSTMTLDA